MPKVPDGKLTIKQKKFVKAYVANDGNGKQAYKEAYGVTNDNTAAAEASTTLNKPNVKQAIDKALERQGITIDVAIAPIAEALNHKQLDYRLKGSDRALKLMGADKNENSGNTFIFNKGDVVAKKYVKD